MEERLSPRTVVLAALVAGCGGAQPATDVPPRAAPLPTAAMGGQQVTVYPLTLVATDRELNWGELVGARADALSRADSLVAAFLTARAPEVTWIFPDDLRRAARRAPGLLAEPDQIATALLRSGDTRRVPDPLRSQMRGLTGVVGDRYALVPASLVFVPAETRPGRAELSLVVTDVRTGMIEWRTTAWAEADDPWTALWDALTTLVPDLP